MITARLAFLILLSTVAEAATLVVAQDGSGDFGTIQAALDAIPAESSQYRTILIRNGTYREKVMIAKSHVALVGEDRERTCIEFAELRRNWRASHPDDWGAAVINIGAGVTDVIVANLTVINDYGRRNGGEDDHQFAIRGMETSNRIAVLHANVIADGGDTFSPWNSESGLSYATDSYFEGHVDFVCPRGWSYITNSRFFGRSQTASIWHDGSRHEDQKFVVRRGRFDGVPGFPLGRNHRDAQFYLIDAELSPNVADRPIYPAVAPDPRVWGKRYYYANVRREGGDFAWFADNLQTAEGSPREEDITAEWTFGGRWSPASLPAVLPFAAIPRPENGWRWVDPSGVTLQWTPGRDAIAQRVHFGAGDSPEFRVEQRSTSYETGPLRPGETYTWRVDTLTSDGIVPGRVWSFRVDPRPVPPAWSARMADSVMKRTPDPMWLDATDAPRWEYTPGLILKAIFDVAQRTGEERYWKYAKAYYDGFIGADGSIRAYRMDDYNIDRINPGKPLFLLYEKTREEKYRKAIEVLRQQMREHPRTSEGGFWHKKRYPHQMWLDGLYMGAPFLAQYAKVFEEPALFDDVIRQFVLMETHARDDKTGLLFHGWDESGEQKWSDPKTGRSPALWGRAMGWYAMGLVETLDFIPMDHPRRKELIAILQRLAEAVTRVQDPKSGLWWQVVDQPGREGNYLEASVSTMFSFALLKASRLGYIDAKYGDVGRRAYEGIIKELIEVDKDGLVHIHRVCQVAGLGGDPEKGERYRDGTYQYYVTEKIRSNDPKAVGPFIFASLEMERR